MNERGAAIQEGVSKDTHIIRCKQSAKIHPRKYGLKENSLISTMQRSECVVVFSFIHFNTGNLSMCFYLLFSSPLFLYNQGEGKTFHSSG